MAIFLLEEKIDCSINMYYCENGGPQESEIGGKSTANVELYADAGGVHYRADDTNVMAKNSTPPMCSSGVTARKLDRICNRKRVCWLTSVTSRTFL